MIHINISRLIWICIKMLQKTQRVCLKQHAILNIPHKLIFSASANVKLVWFPCLNTEKLFLVSNKKSTFKSNDKKSRIFKYLEMMTSISSCRKTLSNHTLKKMWWELSWVTETTKMIEKVLIYFERVIQHLYNCVT